MYFFVRYDVACKITSLEWSLGMAEVAQDDVAEEAEHKEEEQKDEGVGPQWEAGTLTLQYRVHRNVSGRVAYGEL